jgi:hypothetical protein
MNRIAVVDNSRIAVWVYPDRRMIHHRMKAFCFGNDFREALTRGTEAMQRHGATKWLSDDRANGALPPDDGVWATEVWFTQTKAAGWKHWAIVLPTKILGQSSLARYAKLYAEMGITTRMFADPNEAMRWLEAL